MGRVGYFPSKYVTKLQPGEKALQVTHNLQVTDGAENGLKLLRDQVRSSQRCTSFAPISLCGSFLI